MDQPRAQVYCEECSAWFPVDGGEKWVECECGTRYILTVSEIPAQTIEQ